MRTCIQMMCQVRKSLQAIANANRIFLDVCDMTNTPRMLSVRTNVCRRDYQKSDQKFSRSLLIL